MAKKALYWIGEGVLSQGKDKPSIGYGDEIPESVGKKTIESLMAKGKIAEKLPRVTGGDKQSDAEVQVAALKAENVTLVKTVEGLQGEVAELTEKLTASEKSVAELTDQLTGAKAADKKGN